MIKQWTIEDELLELHSEHQHTAFLISFIKNYSLFNQSNVVNFSGILEKMLDIITTFKTACRVKREEKISFYHLLSKI